MRLKDTGLTVQDIKDKVNKYMIETYERFDFLAETAEGMYLYDENGTLTGYDGDEAWNDCWTVQPMLALEDSWVSYEIGTEHTAPNYSSLVSGNRFRLLFGQSYPLE